ncbi:uncharacterized protein LOC111635494 [Centruroides sculpturatus]|uniref:uncharacterized protein LOC111635494 n=1 Tax=Centruroides sculpturatus TaxID=218467 RepID=UPI000C6CCA1D|nr:uncharacterized protein LOC111635494 [Centruroides sculpturatus]
MQTKGLILKEQESIGKGSELLTIIDDAEPTEQFIPSDQEETVEGNDDFPVESISTAVNSSIIEESEQVTILTEIKELLQTNFLEIKEQLDAIQQQFKLLNAKITSIESKLEGQIREFDEKFNEEQIKREQISFKIDMMNNKIQKRNLIIFTDIFIQPDERESFVRKLFNEELEIKDFVMEEINDIVPLESNNFNNLKLILRSTQRKKELLGAFWKKKKVSEFIKTNRILLISDLCYNSRKRRKKLIPLINDIRQQGKKVYLRDDVILIDGKPYTYSFARNDIIAVENF